LRPTLVVLEERTAPAVFTVTNLADSNAPASGTLRATITASNATPGPNEIDIRTPGTYTLTLNGTGTDNSAGELSILNNSLTLVNQSGGTVIIDASGLTTPERVFDVSPTGPAINVTITGVTIQGGKSVNNFNAPTGGDGAGIRVVGTSSLTLNNDIVQNNWAQSGGGVFSAAGPVTLDATTVRNNKGNFQGGGVAAASIVVWDHSVVTGNTATLDGGGLLGVGIGGPITVTDSSVTNNQAGNGDGGGILGYGNITVTNSTVSGNATMNQAAFPRGNGGGIAQDGNGYVTVMNSLITSNSSATTYVGHGGGGIYIGAGGNATIKDSAIASNSSVNGGGGLFLDSSGNVTIVGCEIDANTAAYGGGLLSSGSTSTQQLTILSSTFFENRATSNGGGLNLVSTAASSQNAPAARLTNVTIAVNGAATGGGLYVQAIYPVTLPNDTIAFNSASHAAGGVFAVGSILTFTNTIVARNSAGTGAHADVDNNGGAVYMMDGGNNFIGDNTGAADSFAAGTLNAKGSFVGTGAAPLDPLLGGPEDNGGAAALPDGSHVLTLADQADSGANGVRDRGNDAAASAADERGFPRPAGAHSDIGAFEFQDADLAVSVSAPPGTAYAGQPLTFVIAVHNFGPNPSHGAVLFDTLPAGTAVLGASSNFTVVGNSEVFAVPDLPSGGSTSLTLTVLPGAPGSFAEKTVVSSHDDPNPANNTATVTVTVLPPPVPASGSADVAGFIRVVPLGRRRGRRLLLFRLTNVGGAPLRGPLGVMVTGLRRGVKLLNASGRTASRQQFVRADLGGNGILDTGASVVVSLVFSQPVRPRALHVVVGAFA
jgi:uncharacterized repeat protein (TIGR01451 family)